MLYRLVVAHGAGVKTGFVLKEHGKTMKKMEQRHNRRVCCG
ncbi:hypothetical protein [Notoacmeibacter sp. MSK16QG-6]|nr:hypothetical protein [Notoacmeibacter sp. MSK16QG-6]